MRRSPAPPAWWWSRPGSTGSPLRSRFPATPASGSWDWAAPNLWRSPSPCPPVNAGRAAIEYIHDASKQPNHAGCVLQNLHVIGNSSVCHGVHLQEVSYPVLQNVIIEGFDGAGLLLDKCQDGSFNNRGAGRLRPDRGRPGPERRYRVRAAAI